MVSRQILDENLDFSRRKIFALRWPDKIESLSCHSFRKKHTNTGTLSLRGKRFVRFGGKEREQESKTVIFWLISRASKTGLCFSLLRNQTETLATQAKRRLGNASFHISNRPSIPCDAYTEQLHKCKHM